MPEKDNVDDLFAPMNISFSSETPAAEEKSEGSTKVDEVVEEPVKEESAKKEHKSIKIKTPSIPKVSDPLTLLMELTFIALFLTAWLQLIRVAVALSVVLLILVGISVWRS